jgi:hypothetical protein
MHSCHDLSIRLAGVTSRLGLGALDSNSTISRHQVPFIYSTWAVGLDQLLIARTLNFCNPITYSETYKLRPKPEGSLLIGITITRASRSAIISLCYIATSSLAILENLCID